MVHTAGKYFIPVSTSVNTHTPGRYEGTNGVANFMVSDDDNAFIIAYLPVKQFVIENGAIRSFLFSNGP